MRATGTTPWATGFAPWRRSATTSRCLRGPSVRGTRLGVLGMDPPRERLRIRGGHGALLLPHGLQRLRRRARLCRAKSQATVCLGSQARGIGTPEDYLECRTPWERGAPLPPPARRSARKSEPDLSTRPPPSRARAPPGATSPCRRREVRPSISRRKRSCRR